MKSFAISLLLFSALFHHRVHWRHGLPYCGAQLAGADESRAAAGKNAAVCR